MYTQYINTGKYVHVYVYTYSQNTVCACKYKIICA